MGKKVDLGKLLPFRKQVIKYVYTNGLDQISLFPEEEPFPGFYFKEKVKEEIEDVSTGSGIT
jgi:hypothetical protein